MNNVDASSNRPTRRRPIQRKSQPSRASSQSHSSSGSRSSTRGDCEPQLARSRAMVNNPVRNHTSAGVKRSRIQFSPQQDAKTLSKLGTKSGYLKQQAPGTKTWNWYYFVIRPATYLYYYQTADDEIPSGVIDLEYLDQVDYKSQVGDMFGKKQFQGSSKYSFRLCSSSENKNAIEDSEIPTEPLELYLDPTLPKEGTEWIEVLQATGRMRGEPDDQSIQVLEGELEKANEMIAELREQLADSRQNQDEQAADRAQEETEYFRQMLDNLSQQTEITLNECRTIKDSLMATGLEGGKSPKARSSSRSSASARRSSGTDKKNPLQRLEQLVALFEDTAKAFHKQETQLVELKGTEIEYQAKSAEKDQTIRSLKRNEAKVSDLQRRLEEQNHLIEESEEKDAHIAKLKGELEESGGIAEKRKDLEQKLSDCQLKLMEQEDLLEELQQDAQYQRKMRDLAEQRAQEAVAWRRKSEAISPAPPKEGLHRHNRNDAIGEGEEGSIGLQKQIYQRLGKYKQGMKNTSKHTDPVPNQFDQKSRFTSGKKEGFIEQSKRNMSLFKSRMESYGNEPEGDRLDQQGDFIETSSVATTESNEELPEGWTRVESRHYPGDFYYYNARTGENSWDFPSAPAKSKSLACKDKEEKPVAGVSQRIQERFTRIAANPTKTNRPRERHTKSIVNLDQSSLIRMGALRKKPVKKIVKPEDEDELSRQPRPTYESDVSEDSDDQVDSNLHEEHTDMKSRVTQAKAIMQNYNWNSTALSKKAKFMMNQKSRFAAWNSTKTDGRAG
uniref:Uncharacterized protein AlNc14C70G4853 n=1 Tax=Albugo laibachii Nc14 TaxID=890382 RepID=F0WDY5_9STRA|nr:conserved hypothetical protein [Albugo laibachii Nc14]|eukprot:CCA19413.1 conserved hypothetical protein [Albugo laibachii Nc14]